MMTQVSRRRFLAISAATLATPASAAPTRWRGQALGAEISLTLHAPPPLAEKAIRQCRQRLRDVELQFSLYDPNSSLSQLNQMGQLRMQPMFHQLVGLCDLMVTATKGVFDPTIQPLWRALAHGQEPTAARHSIGWHRLHMRQNHIQLDRGQALTFNGIAQGFATDLIRADLARLGLEKALINIGEFAAIGGPFDIGLADPMRGLVAVKSLTDRAIATSSPAAMFIGQDMHILHPLTGQSPHWATVSVEAQSAALADAASTAFSLMTEDDIRAARARLPGEIQVTLVRGNGQNKTI